MKYFIKGGTNSMGCVLIYLFSLDLSDQQYIMEKISENLEKHNYLT